MSTERADNGSKNTTSINSHDSPLTKVAESALPNPTTHGASEPATPEKRDKGKPGDKLIYYLIVGGVIVVGVLALAALVATTVLYRKVGKVGASPQAKTPATVQQSSTESSSVANTPESTVSLTGLDPNDMPSTAPLIVNQPRVGGAYDPLITRGDASVGAENRDHSYYYPEQPDSYHYPDVTVEVREQMRRDFV